MPSCRLVPDSVPRQKAFTYVLLIFFTALLIVFYSYPLNMENWLYKKEIENGDSLSHFEITKDAQYDLFPENASNHSELLKKLLRAFISTRRPSSSVQQILKKTSILTQKLDDLSESYTTASTDEFERDKTQNAKTFTSYAKYSDILNESTRRKSNSTESITTPSTSGFENERTQNTGTSSVTVINEEASEESENDSQTTKSELLLNTSKKFKINSTVKEKIESTFSAQEVSTNAELSSLKEHEDKVNAVNKTTTATNENNSSRSAKTFKEVRMEKTAAKTLTTVGNISQEVLTNNSTTEEIKPFFTTVNEASSMPQEGFLVFSSHCKIPDIDPMHPSIRHLIEKNPPLDCSKNHEPLTKAEKDFLILDEKAVLKKIGTHNYTCCYKSVFRTNDGSSDNDVGFGTECIKLHSKTSIKDEFITVECKYYNDTLFYKEFHSFIFDKPKVEKRCRKRKKPQYSVLIIGVDAVSRMNMHRQLNATADYLLREMDAVEMYGFNKVGDNTFPNLIPVLVGYSEKELASVCWKSSDLPLDRCNFLWKRYADKGYRTLYAEDSPQISSFNYLKNGFLHQPTDYYFRNFILAYEDALGRDKPLNCYQCVGSTSETEAVLQWTKKFASHFSERPYFAFSWINSLTHDFLNMGSSADQMYETFFRNLHRSGALNKTIVILMGDHGMRWGEIRNTYIGRLEERLPMLLIALPEEFKRQYPKFAMTLKENSHRLITPFDLHATLVHLLNLADHWNLENTDRADSELSDNFTRRALSLFQSIPIDRSCDDAFIEEHWCTCESSLEVDIDSEEVKKVAQFLLNNINSLLQDVSNKCAILTLKSISDARLWQPSLEHEGHSANDNIYSVIIHTDPSKAVFEGTVKLSQPNSQTTLLGAISRLNLYGNQSSCIDNAVLRKYCYCL